MRVENHGFFYYKKEYKGDGSLTAENKRGFYTHYSDFCRKAYRIPPYSVKACPEAEAKELDSLVGVPVSAPKYSRTAEKEYKSPLLNREIVFNKTEITDISVKTLYAEDKTAKIELFCRTSEPCKIKLYIAPAWPKREAESFLGEFSSNGSMKTELTLKDVNLWSAETPELYDIRFEADGADDRVVEAGFRRVERIGKELFVNGKRYFLKGAFCDKENKEEPTDWQIIWQYLMIKRMQANAMRFEVDSYEQNDVRFARLADRLGVMLICDGMTADMGSHPSLLPSELLENTELSFKGNGAADPDSKDALKISKKEPSGDSEWRIAQSEEAYEAHKSIVIYRIEDKTDMWYNLQNDKNAPIDALGYAKCAYYVMQEGFKKVTCLCRDTEAVRTEGFAVKPILFGEVGETYAVTVAITDENGAPVCIKTYGDIDCERAVTELPEWKPSINTDGYYAVKTIIIKKF